MAQADTLVALVRAVSGGDHQMFRKSAEALIQEEKGKGHRVLAERLEKALLNASAQTSLFQSNAQRSKQSQTYGAVPKDLVAEVVPERSLDSLVLPEGIRTQLRELVEEQHRAELLHAHALSPMHRVLLAGPPGNGKTTVAEALAFELMAPLIVVRYESLIGSYLGETSARLKALLDYVRTQRCVLFFDEFETLGKERGDTHETGEIKRVVSSLLLQLDALPDYVVVVAASNHPELLDRAVWRRFQIRLELPKPTRAQLTTFVASIAQKSNVNFGVAAETVAKRLLGLSFSEVEEFCLGVVRRAVLNRQVDDAKAITMSRLAQWKERLMPKGEVASDE
ncbi:AAA family ATPase [Roseateles noduli]|nr:AAA family ATPase [Roseateles noduli]